MQIGLRKLLHLKYNLADEWDENGLGHFFSRTICELGLSEMGPNIEKRILAFRTVRRNRAHKLVG